MSSETADFTATRFDSHKHLLQLIAHTFPHIIQPSSTAAFFLDTGPLKMGPIDSPETSVNRHVLRNNPEEGRIQLFFSYRDNPSE